MTYVYQELTSWEIEDMLKQDEYANWSDMACYVLSDYLIDYAHETDEPFYFNPVDIRCTWTEYDNLKELKNNYCLEFSDGLSDKEFLKKVRDITTLLEVKHYGKEELGYLVVDF